MINLTGVKFGVVGSGDLFYEEYYCVAVDAFSDALTNANAIQGVENLKINLFPDDDAKISIINFVNNLVK